MDGAEAVSARVAAPEDDHALAGGGDELLVRNLVAGATVVRPESGFGSHHRMHTLEGGLDTDHHMPLRIEFIDSAENVEALLPRLTDLVTDGLIEAHDTMVLKVAVDGDEGDAAARKTR